MSLARIVRLQIYDNDVDAKCEGSSQNGAPFHFCLINIHNYAKIFNG